MGPIALFDKSFIQSLSLDESVWFDHFFLSNICPVFFIETLADLGKRENGDKKPFREVEIIADKFPDLNSIPSAHHIELTFDNLLGHEVPMFGQIVIDRGRVVSHKGKPNLIAGKSPTTEAFQRWQKSEFEFLEKEIAHFWRTQLSIVDLTEIPDIFLYWPPFNNRCTTIEQARDIALDFINSIDIPYLRIELCLTLLEIPEEHRQKIRKRWVENNYQSINDFAPYAAFVISIIVFFILAIRNNLISSTRVSNLTDIAYLFYLPFCMIFISSDRLHQRIIPLFLRDNQEFVWGQDLKYSLAELNLYYAQFSEDHKNEGIRALAPCPPLHLQTLVSDLWDRHLLPWRKNKEKKKDDMNLEEFRKLQDKVTQIEQLPGITKTPKEFKSDEIEGALMKRQVRRKKGSWYQIPKDLESK